MWKSIPPAPSVRYIRAYRSANTVWIAAHDVSTLASTAMVGSSWPMFFSTSTTTTPTSVTSAAKRTTACAPQRVGSSRVACDAVSSGPIGATAAHVQTTKTAATVAQPASTAATADVQPTTMPTRTPARAPTTTLDS